MKGEGKAAPIHTVKANGGNGGTATLIINLGTRWSWVFSFVSWPLYVPGNKRSTYWIGKLGGFHNQLGRFGEEKHLLRYWYPPARSLVMGGLL